MAFVPVTRSRKIKSTFIFSLHRVSVTSWTSMTSMLWSIDFDPTVQLGLLSAPNMSFKCDPSDHICLFQRRNWRKWKRSLMWTHWDRSWRRSAADVARWSRRSTTCWDPGLIDRSLMPWAGGRCGFRPSPTRCLLCPSVLSQPRGLSVFET